MITGYASKALSRSFVHGHKMGKVTNCNALLIILIENAQASNNITFIMLLTGDIHAQKKIFPRQGTSSEPRSFLLQRKPPPSPSCLTTRKYDLLYKSVFSD